MAVLLAMNLNAFSSGTRLFEDPELPGHWHACDLPFLPTELCVAIGSYVAFNRCIVHFAPDRQPGALVFELDKPITHMACDDNGVYCATLTGAYKHDGRDAVLIRQFRAVHGFSIDSRGWLCVANLFDDIHRFSPLDEKGRSTVQYAQSSILTSRAYDSLDFPARVGLAAGSNGDVYIAIEAECRVYVMSADGQADTFCGIGWEAYDEDADDVPVAAALAHIRPTGGMVMAPDRTLYIGAVNAIFRVTPDGIVTKVLAATMDTHRCFSPTMALDPAGHLYLITDRGLIRMSTRTGVTELVRSMYDFPSVPKAICVDSRGTLYVACDKSILVWSPG